MSTAHSPDATGAAPLPPLPTIIQGGMGVGVSHWRLAQAVSRAGQLGVISGTALSVLLARRLQDGDKEGHVRRAMSRFPVRGIAARLLAEFFVPHGRAAARDYRRVPMPSFPSGTAFLELTVMANFVEVFLAKENHSGSIGINLLEKIQLCTVPSLYGAMLAGVDYVLMGAGIPRNIPGVLDDLAAGRPAGIKIDVAGARPGEEYSLRFDPQHFFPTARPLARPRFLAVVSSATLALTLARRSNGRVDGFVIENSSAGGHNAPPRGPMTISPAGEPIYGPRDVPELAKIRDVGLPFWLAGSNAHPARLAEARAQGATGIQVGTAFAFCTESGIDPDLKQRALSSLRSRSAEVFTDPQASPTGFPFKVLQLTETLSERTEYLKRDRVCDLGLLRTPYRKPDGSVGYRCSGEPEDDYVRKGGTIEETPGRKCLCNALLSTASYPQRRKDGYVEPPLVTSGVDSSFIEHMLPAGQESYAAGDVIDYLLSAVQVA